MTQISTIVILAAGQGTRMKSKKAKVLHSFAGRTLLSHSIHTALEVNPERIVLVVRHQRDAVAAEAKRVYPDIIIADQDEVPGTGRAVWCALEKLRELEQGQQGTLVVTSADVPLMESSTILSLAETREDEGSALCLLTTKIDNPFGYGRIQRIAGQVAGIVEESDATYAQRQIKEVNAGIYAFDVEFLASALPKLSADNAQGEIYLTDTLKAAREAGRKVSSVLLADTAQAEGCNDRAQLAELRAEYNRRRTRYWMLHGVTIIDPSSTWIDADVTVGMDTTIYPNTQLRKNTVIGEDCRIGPDSTLIDVTVGDGAEVFRVHGISSEIGSKATIGPFTYLRPGTRLGPETKVGGFCETKNIEVGRGTKIPHLSYVGDATIGEGTNIGAATIFANYDGVNKHHSTVGSYCRTGADNIFIAPVHIGDGVYTGGGTIVRHDIPAGALAVNQFDMRIIPDWVASHRPDTDAARAAAGEIGTTDTESEEPVATTPPPVTAEAESLHK